MNQENKPRSDTLEAEKPAVAAPQQAAPGVQQGQQGEKPRVEASKDAGKAEATPIGSQPTAQQPDKAAPQGTQQKQ